MKDWEEQKEAVGSEYGKTWRKKLWNYAYMQNVCVRVIKENVSTQTMVRDKKKKKITTNISPLFKKNNLFYGPEIFCVQESQCNWSIVDKEGSAIKRN